MLEHGDGSEAQGYEPDSAVVNLGHAAVDSRIDKLAYEQQLADADSADTAVITELGLDVKIEEHTTALLLQNARETLAKLSNDKTDAGWFNLIDARHMPPIMRMWLDLPPAGIRSDQELINDSTLPARIAALGDEQFLNYLQWHNHRQGEMQKELESKLPEFKKSFSTNVAAAVDEGWLPGEALDCLDQLDSRPVRLTDIFSSEAQGHVGKINRDGIRASATEMRSDEHIHHTLHHEWVHLLAWREENQDETGLNFGEGYTDINEAVTEHITMTLINGRFEVVRPQERAARRDDSDEHVYSKVRDALARLVEEKGIEALRTLVRASFEPDREKAKQMTDEVIAGTEFAVS
jgi:hypothetical protein